MYAWGWLGLGAMLLLGQTGAEKTYLGEPFREVRIDPASVPSDAKTFHVDDLVLRAFLRGPATTRLASARNVNINGFDITLPAGTQLTEKSFVRGEPYSVFGNRGPGHGSVGSVFCSSERVALGPATGGRKPFKGLACFLDADGDHIFEQVTFIGPYSDREVGPMQIEPISYEPVPGELTDDHIDLTFDGLRRQQVTLGTTLFIQGRKHSSFRAYSDERIGQLTAYSEGCEIAAPFDTGSPTRLLGAEITISAADPTGASVTAKIAATPQRVTALVSPDRSISGWIPAHTFMCGSKENER